MRHFIKNNSITLETCTYKEYKDYKNASNFCIKKCLEALKMEKIKIAKDIFGAPIWQEEFIGSISSKKIEDIGEIVCIMASKQKFSHIGIDLEHIVELNKLLDLIDVVVTEEEQKLYKKVSFPLNIFLLLIFSTKESVYKSIYSFLYKPINFQKIIIKDIYEKNEYSGFCISTTTYKNVKNKITTFYFVENNKLYTLTLIENESNLSGVVSGNPPNFW